MKYALMSSILRKELKTKTPYFGDVLKAQALGYEDAPNASAEELRTFLEAHGVPCPVGTLRFEDLVVLAKEAGYQGIDMMSQLLELPGPEVRAILAKHEMALSCINIVAPFCCATSDAEFAQKTDEVRQTIDQAADAGAESVLIMPAYTWLPSGMSREAGFQQMLRGMRESAQYAKQKGVQLTTETLQFIKTPYCSNGEILRMLEAVPELTFTLDTGNCLPMLENPLEILDCVADRLIGVHIKDMQFVGGDGDYATVDGRQLRQVPYGQGLVDYPALHRRLVEMDFRGWVAFEGMSRNSDPKLGIREDLAWFQSL